MKCPVCVKKGLKSKVYGAGVSATTDMGYEPYHDEDGNIHYHDPNRSSMSLSCSLGHSWGESHVSKCPSCDYGSEGPSITIRKDTEEPKGIG